MLCDLSIFMNVVKLKELPDSVYFVHVLNLFVLIISHELSVYGQKSHLVPFLVVYKLILL